MTLTHQTIHSNSYIIILRSNVHTNFLNLLIVLLIVFTKFSDFKMHLLSINLANLIHI